jgi:hypothetical protein
MKKSKTKTKKEVYDEEMSFKREALAKANYTDFVNEKKMTLEKEELDDKDILDKIGEQINKKEPIIELFDLKNINLKANISEEQRNIIVILMATYNQAVSYGVDLSCIKLICADFVEMSPSIDGKRAEQYVDAHRQAINQFMNPMNQNGQYGNYSDKMQQMRK